MSPYWRMWKGLGLFLSSVERGESEGEAAELHVAESCLLEDTLHDFAWGKASMEAGR